MPGTQQWPTRPTSPAERSQRGIRSSGKLTKWVGTPTPDRVPMGSAYSLDSASHRTGPAPPAGGRVRSAVLVSSARFSDESYSGVCPFTVERQILADNSYLTTFSDGTQVQGEDHQHD